MTKEEKLKKNLLDFIYESLMQMPNHTMNLKEYNLGVGFGEYTPQYDLLFIADDPIQGDGSIYGTNEDVEVSNYNDYGDELTDIEYCNIIELSAIVQDILGQ